MARLSLIGLLGLGLLTGGITPPEHLHHSTATRPQYVHSHIEFAAGSAEGHHGPFDVADADHAGAVGLERVIAGGPRPPASGPPLILAAILPFPAACSSSAPVSMPAPEPTVSPPRRSLAPRAPPA